MRLQALCLCSFGSLPKLKTSVSRLNSGAAELLGVRLRTKELTFVVVFSASLLAACSKESESNTTLSHVYKSIAYEGENRALQLIANFQPRNEMEKHMALALEGELSFRVGDFKRASEALSEAIKLSDQRLELSVLLAKSLDNLGKRREASRVLARARDGFPPQEYEEFDTVKISTLNPVQIEFYLFMASLYSDEAEALSILQEGLLRNTGSRDIFHELVDRLGQDSSELPIVLEKICPQLRGQSPFCLNQTRTKDSRG